MPSLAPPAHAPSLSRRLEAWSRAHALLLALGSIAAASWRTPLPLTTLALASFLGLFVLGRGRFTERATFGLGNAVTSLRLVLVATLGAASAALPASACGLLAAVVFALDGVDGWLARRTRCASVFGAHFDMETDALLTLVLAFVLYTQGRFGPWILFGGLLRPTYVLTLWVLPAIGEQPRSRFARFAFFGFASGLIVPFWSRATWADAWAALGTVAVALSFARGGLHWYRARAGCRAAEVRDVPDA